MLMIIEAKTSTSRSTESALPSPWLLPPQKETRHISTAITFAAAWEEPGGMTYTKSNIFSTLIMRVTSTTMMTRSEEHTSELQSRGHLVCRLLLEKKK